MWVLKLIDGYEYYMRYDYINRSVVQCDSRIFAQAFPSRTAAESVAAFHGVADRYMPTTIYRG